MPVFDNTFILGEILDETVQPDSFNRKIQFSVAYYSKNAEILNFFFSP